MEFPETNWTVLAVATMNGGEGERDALNQLCQDYWKPVSIVIRGRGAPPERVEDLTQDFFLQLMQKGFFKKADKERGSFRSFILGSLRYFLADDAKRNLAQKKGGHLARTELNDEIIGEEQQDDLAFDAAWAEQLFTRVLDRLEQDVTAQRGTENWAVLRTFLPGGGTAPSYQELGQTLGITEGGAKAEVFRLRGKFREGLRQEVARTVSAPHEVDEELAYLRQALSR